MAYEIDMTQSAGYFGYFKKANFRQKKQSLLLSQFQYPITYTTLRKNKIDNIIHRAGVQTGYMAITADTSFTLSNLKEFYDLGYDVIPYFTMKPWNATVPNDIDSLGDGIANILKSISDVYPIFTNNNIILEIVDDGNLASSSWTPAMLLGFITDLKNDILSKVDYLDNIILRTNYYTSAIKQPTYTDMFKDSVLGGVADICPCLLLDNAYFPSSVDGSSYPNGYFTQFGGYSNPSISIYTRTNSLGSTYGLTGTGAVLAIQNPYNSSNLFKEKNIEDEEYGIMLATQDYKVKHIETNKMGINSNITNLSRYTNVNNVDYLEGTIDNNKEVAKWINCNNKISYLDIYGDRQMYNIVEVENITGSENVKNFRAEHISAGLSSDVVYSAIGTSNKTIGNHITDILTYSTNQVWELGSVFGFISESVAGSPTNISKYLLLGDLSNLQYSTVLEALDIVKQTFNCHFVFRVVQDRGYNLGENYVRNYYIDVYENIGCRYNQTSIDSSKQSIALNNTTDLYETYTAILPYSENISTATYGLWSNYVKTSGIYKKVSGGQLVYADNYKVAGTSSNSLGMYKQSDYVHRVKYMEFSEATNYSDLFDLAVQQLAQVNKTSRQLSVDLREGIVLEKTSQFPHIGDYIIIADKSMEKIWDDDTNDWIYTSNMYSAEVVSVEYDVMYPNTVKLNVGKLKTFIV